MYPPLALPAIAATCSFPCHSKTASGPFRTEHLTVSQNTTGTPIRLDLLPCYPGMAAVPLNPPLNFRGTLGFTVPFDYVRVGAWDPDNNHMNFIQSPQKGLMYVSVQTVAMPGGAHTGQTRVQAPVYVLHRRRCGPTGQVNLLSFVSCLCLRLRSPFRPLSVGKAGGVSP
ncbi:hypothetical protein Vafri_3707 [Volvox africanus]|uniref:Uncharacterized protein n=1 Tax=Volvox africanus TaxID=51714 RepID=A0A8J4ASJ3_9CHLO|nr:hypothetical protein Vafri_3707 [Volvox africanus]